MKKIAIPALLTAALVLFTACREVGEKKPPSSQGQSSAVSSGPASSEINDTFPDSSEPGPVASEPVSSEEERPALAPASIEAEGVDLSALEQFETQAVTWGPGHAMDDVNRPTACIQLQEKYGGHGGLFLMPEEEKTIYLTFDEGYENGYTSKILDVLKEKECPAVFFVTMDYVKKEPELIRRMIDEGHVVGNHSVHHLSMPTLDSARAVEEISGLHNYVVENFNYQMTLFRPPEGAFSERSLEAANAVGYTTTLWSFAYKDYDVKNQPDRESAFKRVTEAAHPGAVYLLHAVSQTNTEMLGDVIDALRGQGYTLGKLDSALQKQAQDSQGASGVSSLPSREASSGSSSSHS